MAQNVRACGSLQRLLLRRPVGSGMRTPAISYRMGTLRVRAGSQQDRNTAVVPEVHERAISVLRGAVEFDWKTLMPSSFSRLGGTLVVSDAEHKDIVQRAHQEGTLSFGFSAGGTLFPYYIGVSGALQDGGVLTEHTKVAGASAGSLIAAVVKSGMPVDEVTEQSMRLMADLRQHGTRGRLGKVLRRFLEEHLPPDAAERCQDRAYVAVTKALYVKPQLVSQFESREDLIGALLTSCHVPYWLDGTPWTDFRGELHLDGGLTDFIPVAPGTVGVRVSCFAASQLSPVYRIGISPDSFEPWPHSLRQMVAWALEPADEDITAYLIEKGRCDAQSWMQEMGLNQESKAAEEAAHAGGQVAAAKEQAVGSEQSAAQRGSQEQGEQKLKERAQHEAEAGARAA